jgi:DNA invertase Pin-like site-specific DNA recombinase
VIAYLRVSTSDQANGLETQREAIEGWAAAQGARVVAWCADRGVSGAAPLDERPGLLEALARLQDHGAGVLLAAKRDRLARDVSTAAAIERLTREAGASVVTADGLDCSDTPEGQLVRTLIDAMAQYERALIRARTKAVLAAKRRRGEKLGGKLPFGHRVVEHGDGVKRLAPDDLEQGALRFMRRLRDDGRTFEEVAAELTTGNWPSRGKKWHASTVLRALRRGEQCTDT